MIRRRAEKGFRVVSWAEAYAAATEQIQLTEAQRFAVYVTSRGMMNEHYYAVQKAARAMGTNHVDNSARLCHAASTVAMKRTLATVLRERAPGAERQVLRLHAARKTGASRNDVFTSREDTQLLGVEDGKYIRLVSSVGIYVGRVKIDEIKPGNLEVHWPESICLLSREEMDFASREPNYNVIVRAEKAIGTAAT